MSTFKKFVAYSLIFVICSISLLGSVVSVYADSVTSLPSHSDIISSFDANNVYLDTPDGSYTISRTTVLPSFNINGLQVRFLSAYSFSNGGYISSSSLFNFGSYNYCASCYSFQYIYRLSGTDYTISAPVSFESDLYNRPCDASYWYSPSLNSVFVVNSSYNYTSECSSTKVLSYYSSPQGSSFRLDIESVSCTNYFINYYNLDSGNVYQSVGQFVESSSRPVVSYFTYFTGTDFVNFSIPDDLVCIYSTYIIDGFWEVDPLANIVTPDYFFNYQYLFEGIDNYIIFIDSSKPITNFNYSNGTISFSDFCNKRIYVTTDGVSWLNICSSSLMYSNAFALDSKYYKNDNPDDPFSFRLIYSNDESYGEEPLVKPEFNSSFTKFDFYSKFPSFIEEYIEGETDWPDAYHIVYPSSGTDNFNVLQYILYGGYGAISDLISILGFSPDHLDLFVDELFGIENISISDAFTLNIFNSLTQEFIYKFDSSGNLISRTRTIYGYLKNVSENIYDTKLLIDQFRLDILTPLGSLFDISSFNADRLVDITALIKGIKIPDYSKKLDSIIASLTSSSVPSFDDSGIIVAINNAAFDDTAILDAINNISITSGGGSSPTVSVDLDKLYKLLDFDISDYDDDKTDDDTRVVDFVVDGLNDLVSGSVLQDALDFAPGVLSGIGLVNGFVVNIYDNLGNYKPVVLLGLTFTVVGTVIRKEES